MILAWVADPHLVFVTQSVEFPWDELTPFLERLAAAEYDALVVSGDISESPLLTNHLRKLEQYVHRPVFFVLGNHDFYHGTFARTRDEVRKTMEGSQYLRGLDQCEPIQLTADTTLIGHGGWADGGYGDLGSSRTVLNDWKAIEDLRYWKRGPHRLVGLKGFDASTVDWMRCRLTYEDVDWQPLADHLQALGNEAAEHIRRVLPLALTTSRRVILVTHVPPFLPATPPRGLHWDTWAPHAGCKAMGDAILEIMRSHPSAELLILSGHVHYQSRVSIGQNIEQRTAWAAYGEPCVSDFIDVE